MRDKNNSKKISTQKKQAANPLSLERKVQIINQYETYRTSHRDLAKEHGASQSQIQRTLAKKDAYLMKWQKSIKTPGEILITKPSASLTDKNVTELSDTTPNNNIEAISGVDIISQLLFDVVDPVSDADSHVELSTEHKPLCPKRKLMFDDDSMKCSRQPIKESVRDAEENVDNNESENDMSEKEFGQDDVNRTNDDEEKLTSDEKYLKKTFYFLKNKASENVHLTKRAKRLKRELNNQKINYEKLLAAEREKNDALRKQVDDLEKSKLVKCVQCHEEKPKLTIDFCSFQCFQGVCSPQKAKDGESS